MGYEKQLVVLLMAMGFAFLPQTARAQRRGEVVEGLLRGFIESQLDSERQKALERQQRADRQRHHQPPQRPFPNPRPGASPQLQSYRATMSVFERQSAGLANRLQQSATRVRGARPLLADALRIKTTAALMHEQSQKSNDLALLREEFCGLDCQWRDLSFRLRQLQGWDASTMGYIQQLDGCCNKICDLMELEPQFDREAVFRLSVETTAYLNTLLDDIQYELYGLQAAASLAGECRNLVEQSRRMSTLTSQAPYDAVLIKYASFVSNWRKFAAQVYPHENPYCNRDIRRVRTCNRQIFEQLRKPLSIDRTYLSHVSHMMAQEVDSLLENMTVKALVQMPANRQQSFLSTARELYGLCNHYCECVESNSPLSDLMADYIEINDQWVALDGQLTDVTSRTVVTNRRLITDYDVELRGLMRIPARLDRAHAMQLAASLEDLAEQLRYDVRRYGRYYRSDSFRVRAYQSSDAFYAQAQRLRAQIQSGTSVKELQTGCSSAITSWDSLSQIISAMPANGLASSRYQIFRESHQEVLPVVAELAMLLGT